MQSICSAYPWNPEREAKAPKDTKVAKDAKPIRRTRIGGSRE